MGGAPGGMPHCCSRGSSRLAGQSRLCAPAGFIVRPDANGEAQQAHVGLSPKRNFGHTSVVARSVVQRKACRRRTLSNKGMKLTKPERIGASQLIPGVRRTCRRGVWLRLLYS